MLTISLAPIHYGPAADLEIETAWQPASAPWIYQMVEADYRAFALQRFDAGQIVKYVHALTGEQITFQPQQLQWTNDLDQIQAIGSPANVLASAVDDTLSWTGAFGEGRDFR